MHDAEPSLASRAAHIIEAYGAGAAACMPSAETWATLTEIAPAQPVTLVNFFKLRARAAYPADFSDADVSGRAAFDRYAAVSMPALAKAGGRFLLVAPFAETFIGAEEDWDLVAVGTYPGPGAVLALFENPEYHRAYAHRVAACAAQRVSLCIG